DRNVKDIARYAVKPRKYGQLLYRMVRSWQPKTILELGTSLGITTAYLGLGAPGARLVTIEGAPEIAAIAEENIRLCGAGNASVMTGNFDDLLPGLISSMERIDFAFIDGNHQEQPTIR